MLCQTCNTCIDRDNTYNDTLTRLEQKILLLNPQLNISQVMLNNSCLVCLRSMLHDTETELAAIEERKPTYDLLKQFVEIKSSTEEYRTVHKRFTEGAPQGATVFRIEKNYNPKLFQEFKDATRGKGNEQLLFHGSQTANYMSILTGGFDIKKSNNGSLGVGVYFARNASYSTSFTSPLILSKDTGTKETKGSTEPAEPKDLMYNILVCRVVLPPDTGVGCDIWAVRNDRYGYPEYIIYYRIGTHS